MYDNDNDNMYVLGNDILDEVVCNLQSSRHHFHTVINPRVAIQQIPSSYNVWLPALDHSYVVLVYVADNCIADEGVIMLSEALTPPDSDDPKPTKHGLKELWLGGKHLPTN
eukprot:scaffold10288_cov19-Prasinocladus_malaysianus.AAC.1